MTDFFIFTSIFYHPVSGVHNDMTVSSEEGLDLIANKKKVYFSHDTTFFTRILRRMDSAFHRHYFQVYSDYECS